MLPIFTGLLVTSVVAEPIDIFISTLAPRQTTNPLSNDCNSTCSAFSALQAACTAKHCGCNDSFLEAQGDCLVCQADTPNGAASVQFLIEAEVAQCQREGIPIHFTLQLPPAAQAIVDETNNQSAVLRREQTAFLALQIAGGHIGLVIVLAHAVFSRKVDRDPTFFNFCFTWIFSSIVYSILLYRGTHGNTVTNPFGFVLPSACLAQASLINGAQVMTAYSTLALVVQLWIALRAAVCGKEMKQNRMFTFVLLGMPYILFLIFVIATVIDGRQIIDIQGVSFRRAFPANFYCAIILFRPLLRAIYGMTLGLLIITMGFDVLIIMMLYRHWLAFRRVQPDRTVSLSILIRVIVFSVYRVIVSVAYGSALTVLDRPPKALEAVSGDSIPIAFSVPVWVDMLQAAIPLVAFIVFGINMDMINSLMFWRKHKSDYVFVLNPNPKSPHSPEQG